MASKHSKSIFDFKKSAYTLPKQTVKSNEKPLLPFQIIVAFLIVSLILSSVLIGRYFLQSSYHQKLLLQTKTTFESLGSTSALKALSSQNKDIKGWIKIDGTEIDSVVCQSEDNTFYINHNQLGKKSRYGALFLSNQDSFSRKNNDKNIVIFGNNMKDGSMFGTLKKYRNLNFYKENPCVKIYYGKKSEKYIVFAVMLVASSSDSPEKAYSPTKSFFVDENDFNDWSNETLARSIINTNIKAEYGDELLTLITSANDFDGARLVVVAKKADDWEIEHADVISATINQNIKYPKLWYETKGLDYPY